MYLSDWFLKTFDFNGNAFRSGINVSLEGIQYKVSIFSTIPCNFPMGRTILLKIKFFVVVLLLVVVEVGYCQSDLPSKKASDQVDSLLNVLYEEAFYSDYQAGNAILDTAAAYAIAGKLPGKQAEVHINRAWLAQNFGDLQLMKQSLAKAKPIISKNESRLTALVKGDFYYTEASYLTRLGDHLGSIKSYQKIISGEFIDSLLFHDTYNSIGFNFLKVGNPLRALEYYEKAMQYIAPSLDEFEYKLAKSLGYQSLGLSYVDYFLQTKDSSLLNDGTNQLSLALELIDELPVSPLSTIHRSSVLTNLAKANLHTGTLDLSLHYLTKAREIHKAGDAFLYFIEKMTGDVMVKKQDYVIALQSYQKAFEIAKEKYTLTDTYTIDIYVKLARALLKTKDFRKARNLVTNVLSAISERKDQMSTSSYANLILPLQTVLTNIEYEAFLAGDEDFNDQDVMLHFNEAMALVHQLRKAFPDRRFKEFISSESKQMLANAMNYCFLRYQNTGESHFIANAFRYSEESKALTLLEHTIDQDAISFAGIPDSIVQEGDLLKRSIAEIEISSSDSMKSELEVLRRKFENYVNRLEAEYPAYYDLKYEVNLPALKTIQEELNDDEVVLQYFFDIENVFVINISSESASFSKIENFDLSAFQQLLRALQTNPTDQQVADPYQHYKKMSKRVFEQLEMGNITEAVKKLIIIPDGQLHLMPFEVLIDKMDRKLLERYSISYDLSVALMYYRIRKESDEFDREYVGFAPSYSGDKFVNVRNEQINESEVILRLGRLAYNEQEIRSLGEIFTGDLFVGEAATKSRFLQEVMAPKVFHLSAHGLYNDRTPLNSAIYFHQKDTGTYQNENALHAYEIYGTSIEADLGILSSCESGFGDYKSGEGLSSLRRAFYFAGCKSIVASLWYANDKATFEITRQFGQLLEAGERKDEALRLAKIAFLDENSPAFKHPYYWAHLTVSGDTAVISDGNGMSWLYAGTGLVLLILVLISFRRKFSC